MIQRLSSVKMEIENSGTIPCSLGLVFPRSSIATKNLIKFRSTLLVNFIRPRTSRHGPMMSLVAITRSSRFRAQTRVTCLCSKD
jgi:hypothetical protein